MTYCYILPCRGIGQTNLGWPNVQHILMKCLENKSFRSLYLSGDLSSFHHSANFGVNPMRNSWDILLFILAQIGIIYILVVMFNSSVWSNFIVSLTDDNSEHLNNMKGECMNEEITLKLQNKENKYISI